MNSLLNKATRLAVDFNARTPTERLDLLSGLFMEGHARQVNAPNDDLEYIIYGVSACGKDSLDLIENYIVMVARTHPENPWKWADFINNCGKTRPATQSEACEQDEKGAE